MRRSPVLVALLLIASSSLGRAQVSNPTRTAPQEPRSDRVTGWGRDIDSLLAVLNRVHPKYKDCGVDARLRAEADSLKGQLERLSDPQILVALQHLLAQVGDGHTALWPFGMQRGQLLRADLSLWAFEDGLYVTAAADQHLVGKRVARIGGVPAAELEAKLRPYISHDNDAQLRWAFPLYATFLDYLRAVGGTARSDSVEVEFTDATAVRLPGLPVDPAKLDIKLSAPVRHAADYLRRRPEAFWTRSISSTLLYAAVNAIDDAPGETLAQFGIELRRQLRGKPAVVVDLRLNSGGEASKADELLRSLITFDTQGGRIAVLTSRMTFSAAQTLASRLDQWTSATFVGEATGSSPNHYGNERPLRLAYSGARGTVSSGYNQPVTARDTRSTITPDVAVPTTAEDYFAGRDRGLEQAIATLRRSPGAKPPVPPARRP